MMSRGGSEIGEADLAAYFGGGPVEGLRVRDVVVPPTAGPVHTLALGCEQVVLEFTPLVAAECRIEQVISF